MHPRLGLAPLPTILLLHIFSTVQATNFTFTFGKPTQCDSFPVSWTGGAPPFEVVLIPELGSPRTINVPSGNYSNGKGSFETQLPFASGKRFLVTMSDSSGFASGGISAVQTVANSTTNTNCNTTDPGVDFTFEANSALAQCRYYTFSNYTEAVQPVTIYGVVPGGNSFILDPPKRSTEFDWLADIAGGTQLIFIMTDSKGRQGGSGPIVSATITDDSSCLDANSPASVSNFPSETASGTSGASTSSPSGPASSAVPESSSNTGAIVGGVIGGLFAAFSIGVLAVFFWRRRKTGRRGGRGGRGGNGGFALPFGGSRERRLESVDLDAPTASTDGHPTAHVIQPYPYTQADTLTVPGADGAVSYAMSPSAQNLLMQQGRGQDAHYDASRFSALHDPDPFSPTAQSTLRQSQHTHQFSSESGGMSTVVGSAGDRRSSVSSAARRKAAMAGMPSYKPTPRYILHTDLEETQEEQGDVIELPPQYSERRTPITGLGPDYAVPPPGAPPSNPLENHDEPDTRLQQPIEPGPPTPTSPHGRRSPS